MPSGITLRPLHYSFPLSFSSSSSPKSLFKSFSLLSSDQTLTLSPNPNSKYGPSLSRGRNPNPSPNPKQESESIDKSQFSREFEIAALRVPAADCSSFERCLRGHLLNWPRVCNVARVEGDDVDPDFKNLLRNSSSVSEDRLKSLERRLDDEKDEVFSAVLYREKLVKDFNCRGYVKFRHLAKISRPKKKKDKNGESVEDEGKGKRGKGKIYVVEVVGDGEDEEDWSVLIGEGFRGGKWTGPTRLLLLDERYAKKGVDELPEAVKVNFLFSELI